jgi:hypothetical protein
MNLRSTLVTLIFGAGASFGSGGCSPTNPPLGKDLFKHLSDRGGAFSRLDKEAKLMFEMHGFEVGMSMIADDNRQINPLQKELASYLSGFAVRNDNAYVRLFNKLSTVINKLNIATLNYDLLIEQALSIHGLKFDYNGQGNGINLFKPHGSSSFLPKLPKGMVISGNVMIGVGTFIEGLETEAVSSQEEVIRWCNDPKNSDLSPVLAMYAKGKRVVINRELINKIQLAFADTVKKSPLVVLVGIEYVEHDTQVWQPIQESNADILIVNPSPTVTLDWTKNVGLNKVTVFERSFDKSVWDIAKFVRAYYL